VTLRLLRGESLEALSRELGVEMYRLEAWRDRAHAGIDASLRERTGDPVQVELDHAMKRIGSSKRRVLNQSTQASTANSTASSVRHGPRRWITSVLKSPITDSASRRHPPGSHRWGDAGIGQPVRIPHRHILLGFKVSSQQRTV
jgi:hypothetical protein